MPPKRAKKTETFGLRFEPELRARFNEAVAASDMTPAEALRIAAQAMVVAYLTLGKIPRDMEVKQAQIGNVEDIHGLLERVRAIAESQGPYFAHKPKTGQLTPTPPGKPPDKSQRHRGDGPRRAVS